MESDPSRLIEKPCQCGWFQIMARNGIGSWEPLKSLGKPLVFATQEEADFYKDGWLRRKGDGWKAFSYACGFES